MLVLGIEVKPPPHATTRVEENNYYLVLLTCIKLNHINLVMYLKTLRYQKITWSCSEIRENVWWEGAIPPLTLPSAAPAAPVSPEGPCHSFSGLFFHNSPASLQKPANFVPDMLSLVVVTHCTQSFQFLFKLQQLKYAQPGRVLFCQLSSWVCDRVCQLQSWCLKVFFR